MRIFLYRLQFILVISNAEGSTLFVYLFMFLYNPNLSFNLIVLLISQWSRTYWLLIFIILICEILKYLCKYDELFYACTMHALLNMFFLLLIKGRGCPPPSPRSMTRRPQLCLFICFSIFGRIEISVSVSKSIGLSQRPWISHSLYLFST